MTSLMTLAACHNFQRYDPNPVQTNTAQTFYNSALANLEHGRFENALADLDSALHYNPGFANYYRVQGWVYENLEMPDSAITVYERCLSLKSHYPEVWSRLGALYLENGEYGRAAPILKRATQAFPDSLTVLFQLSEAYVGAGRAQLALDALKGYKRAHPSPPELFYKWEGLALHAAGQYPEAVAALSRYVRGEPGDAAALKRLGQAQFEAGALDEAISNLNKALELNPADVETYWYRARYFQAVGKPGIAMQQLEIGLRTRENHPQLLFEIGALSYDRGEFDQAQRYFERLIEVSPDFWRAYRHLGLIAEHGENWKLARRHYETYLEHILQVDEAIRERLRTVTLQIEE